MGTYLGGRDTAGDRDAVARLLDQWTGSDEQLSDSILIATSIMEPSKKNLARILKLREKAWIDIGALTRLVWTGWAERLPTNELRDFLECLLTEDNRVSTEAALTVLMRRLDMNRSEAEVLASSAWHALANRSFLDSTMATYYWGEVSKFYESLDPLRLTHIILDMYKDDRVLFHASDEPLNTTQ